MYDSRHDRRQSSYRDAPRYFSDHAPRYERNYERPRWQSDKPITRRVGAGKRARIAVESGRPNAASEDHFLQDDLPLSREDRRPQRRASHRYDTRPARSDSTLSERIQPRRQTFATRRNSSADSDDGLFAVPGGERVEPIRSRIRHQSRPGYSDEYDFTLPPKVQAVTYDYVEEVSFPADVNSKEDGGRQSQPGRSKFTGAVTEVPITQSRWLGSAFDRGDLGAEISTSGSTAPKGRDTEARDPLMEWFHLERAVMSFEEFMSAAQSVLQVSEQKRRDINKLLRDVQRKFEKQRQHGRDMEPNCMSDLFVGDSSLKESACVIFLSFPYFCLEPYNTAQMKNLTPGTPMHPLRPLLQAHFHSTSQKRELAQAISEFPNTGSGNCLHLSQIWCLIIDDDTMITCSRQSHDALCDPDIKTSEARAGDSQGKMKVSFGNDRSWQIPVDNNTSWPTFLSIFGESVVSLNINGAGPAFRINRGPVEPEQWSFLVGAAQTQPVGIEIDRSVPRPDAGSQVTDAIPTFKVTAVDIQPTSDDPPAQAELPAGQQEPVSTTVYTMEPTGGEEDHSPAVLRHASGTSLENLADDLDQVLRSNSRENEKSAYQQATNGTPFAMMQWSQASGSAAEDPRRDLIGLAFYLFRFFWPVNFSHALTDKYWGAVEKLLQRDAEAYSSTIVEDSVANLKGLTVPVMRSLTLEFSASPEDLSPLPDAYSKAFLHLTMVFILLSQTSEQHGFGVNNSTIRAHIRNSKDSLVAGKRELATRLKERSKIPDLEELEICSHTSLLALVLNQFSQDVMHGRPDVASTYSDYFAQLDFRITEDPAPRTHQESLRFFLQEMEAILSTLRYQMTVLEAFEQSLRQQRIGGGGDQADDNASVVLDALGDSRQQLILDTCKSRISARIDKFRGLQQRAQDLGEWHRNEMETNKDRQENAIMIFTIVTIVFLPLSFVSSVFGMNTSDVRDMPYGQWAYWAAGVPLTVLVVVGSLWWAGEFEGFGAWVQGALSRKGTASDGYQRIPEPVSYRGRRADGRDRTEDRYAAPRMQTSYEAYPPPPARRTTYPRRSYR